VVAARIGVRFEGVLRAGLRDRDGWCDGWFGALLSGELREADAASEPEMIRATARCVVFGRAQPVLPATTHRGEPVRLRPLRGEDVPAIVAACTDPDSVRFTTVPHPYSAAQAEDFVHTFAPTAWLAVSRRCTRWRTAKTGTPAR
jgi:RimJ/RimL family protein N-acetyltransferase